MLSGWFHKNLVIISLLLLLRVLREEEADLGSGRGRCHLLSKWVCGHPLSPPRKCHSS